MPILLVDNGSLEPAPTLNLRATAAALSLRLGQPVEPVSALHSSAIDPALLGGQPAEILEPALTRRIKAGATDFLILPLFFGPAGLLTGYLPDLVARLTRTTPQLRVRIAAPVVDLKDAADDRVAGILAESVRTAARAVNYPAVIVVDHGSPAREVTAVRDHVAAQLNSHLGSEIRAIRPASMERRAGDEYCFADPLLAAAFDRPGFDAGDVVVALMFFAAGRHAGPGGDIEQICAAVEKSHPGLRIHLTPPIGPHPQLIEILEDRARAELRF